MHTLMLSIGLSEGNTLIVLGFIFGCGSQSFTVLKHILGENASKKRENVTQNCVGVILTRARLSLARFSEHFQI